MEIEGTTFGTITIDGKTYEHDVIIRLSGEVVKRKKKLSKKYYGTSHVLSRDEAKFVFESGCEQLILGSGQVGNVHLSPEAEAYFAKKGCKVLLQSTPEAIRVFNRSHAKKIGLFHVLRSLHRLIFNQYIGVCSVAIRHGSFARLTASAALHYETTR